jgi:hypothetical protein
VSPVKYELGFYIPEDGILHSDRREYLKSDKVHCYSFFDESNLQIPNSSGWLSHVIVQMFRF